MTDPNTGARTERHTVDLKQAQYWVENLPDVIAAQLKAARSSLDDCNALALSGVDLAGYLSVLEPGSERICWGLRLAMDAQFSVFKGALASLARQPRVEIEIDGEAAVVDSTVDGGFVNVPDWTSAFFLAAVCREKPLLDILCQVPVDLLRRSSTRAPEYWNLFAEALLAFWTVDQSFYPKVHAAALATTPSDPNVDDYTLYVGGPLTDLLWSLMRALPGSPDGQTGVERFNQSLSADLDYHRRFYSKEKNNRWRKPEGFLALPLLGLASIAYDFKVPVEVESEYMPRAMVEGACRRSPLSGAKRLFTLEAPDR